MILLCYVGVVFHPDLRVRCGRWVWGGPTEAGELRRPFYCTFESNLWFLKRGLIEFKKNLNCSSYLVLKEKQNKKQFLKPHTIWFNIGYTKKNHDKYIFSTLYTPYLKPYALLSIEKADLKFKITDLKKTQSLPKNRPKTDLAAHKKTSL